MEMEDGPLDVAFGDEVDLKHLPKEPSLSFVDSRKVCALGGALLPRDGKKSTVALLLGSLKVDEAGKRTITPFRTSNANVVHISRRPDWFLDESDDDRPAFPDGELMLQSILELRDKAFEEVSTAMPSH